MPRPSGSRKRLKRKNKTSDVENIDDPSLEEELPDLPVSSSKKTSKLSKTRTPASSVKSVVPRPTSSSHTFPSKSSDLPKKKRTPTKRYASSSSGSDDDAQRQLALKSTVRRARAVQQKIKAKFCDRLTSIELACQELRESATLLATDSTDLRRTLSLYLNDLTSELNN